jgi:hypothetical protein
MASPTARQYSELLSVARRTNGAGAFIGEIAGQEERTRIPRKVLYRTEPFAKAATTTFFFAIFPAKSFPLAIE